MSSPQKTEPTCRRSFSTYPPMRSWRSSSSSPGSNGSSRRAIISFSSSAQQPPSISSPRSRRHRALFGRVFTEHLEGLIGPIAAHLPRGNKLRVLTAAYVRSTLVHAVRDTAEKDCVAESAIGLELTVASGVACGFRAPLSFAALWFVG